MILSYDDRRDIVVAGGVDETLIFCVEHFIDIANSSIIEKGQFSVALSGGTTPNVLFKELASPLYRSRIPWEKVLFFWSDERCVPPESPESNYRTAMESGLASLPIPKQNIYRMPADSPDIEQAAKLYETLIEEKVKSSSFDLVMLGVGEDGHTASLFPKTHGLHAEERLVIANFIPQKNSWRMTLTFDCINSAHHVAIYAMGRNKASIVERVFLSPYDPDELPAQQVGTRKHKALWIMDTQASGQLNSTHSLDNRL